MSTELAPEGKVYQCLACGKRARDSYGYQPIDHGWDESCVLNATLTDEKVAAEWRDEIEAQYNKQDPA